MINIPLSPPGGQVKDASRVSPLDERLFFPREMSFMSSDTNISAPRQWKDCPTLITERLYVTMLLPVIAVPTIQDRPTNESNRYQKT